MVSSAIVPSTVAVTICRSVDFADTDASGVVHFTRYGVYLESVGLRLLRELGVLQQLEEAGMVPCVRGSELRYLSPARFGDDLICMGQLEEVGGAHITIRATVLRPDRGMAVVVAAMGLITVTFVNADFKLQRIPKPVLDLLRSKSARLGWRRAAERS